MDKTDRDTHNYIDKLIAELPTLHLDIPAELEPPPEERTLYALFTGSDR